MRGFQVSVMLCSGLQNIHEHSYITFNCTSTKKGLVQPQAEFILVIFYSLVFFEEIFLHTVHVLEAVFTIPFTIGKTSNKLM